MAEDKNKNSGNDEKGLVPLNKKSKEQRKLEKSKESMAAQARKMQKALNPNVREIEHGGRVNGVDTGLACLIAIAKFYNIPADYRQLERAYVLEEGSVDFITLVRAARELKLKARIYSGLTEADLDRLVYPCMIKMRSGRKIVITTIHEGDIYIMDPLFSQQPVKAEKYKLLMDWSGEAILFTRRFELDKKFQKFGFKWFLPVITKYLPFLKNVLWMSLLLQLLGLAGPFFTQNIIDKVLVHRAADALDILCLGMLTCTLFQTWIMSLRAYLFTNICSKMDVALSSRLFKNINALPLSYFSKWQVGDVVSRIGELETLRSFMTGSSMTI